MKSKTLLFIALIIVSCTTACAQDKQTAPQPNYNQLPLDISDVKPLRSLIDLTFEARLKTELYKNKKWKRLIDQKKMAVGLVDLRDPLNVKYARVNGNVMMYAASLPKIAILLAAEDAFENDELEETDEIKQDLRLMISKSDNAASTRMIDRLGYEKIESVLTDPKYDLYDEDYGGGLWVGKRYAKTGERYPDPLKGLSHGATVSQVCRYYYMLAYGKLVSFDRSKIMLDMMVSPELHHKFVNSLEAVAPRAKLFRKSGTWRDFHTDSVLVWGPDGHRYILVALIEDPDGEKICRDLVYEVEKVFNN
ncbi:MAG: class A beta-lactamase-related serine hydrolase [Bacteroidetes bacterium]|nr:class A beta-lactamase-related serine hydrolase [Bacteroidota bacterium]